MYESSFGIHEIKLVIKAGPCVHDRCCVAKTANSSFYPREISTWYNGGWLIIYSHLIQDFCLIVALTLLLVNFFSTYIFQAGLIQLLYTRFRMTLVLCIIYMILSISLHTWHISIHWSMPLKHYWTKEFYTLYSAHRTVAVLYYYFYKRASLRIGDPRFYKSSAWVQKQLSIP
ncbi:hypothetical protein ALC56_00624 [Trachymyrmex septentrionalis]|uniref:Transmembrane protein 138 n=1 Tax=Trachymyrmex septentrionalis TaxID=34720 RepID=A0A195FXD2_9HYME|nr:hypothetical protein ALC56_00624 [Trachymyrmex septentrionalis]